MITLLLLVRATYMYSVVLHAHPVRGESHNQRNTTGEVATTPTVESRDLSRETRPILASLGLDLEGFRSCFGLEGYRSRSQPIVLRL